MMAVLDPCRLPDTLSLTAFAFAETLAGAFVDAFAGLAADDDLTGLAGALVAGFLALTSVTARCGLAGATGFAVSLAFDADYDAWVAGFAAYLGSALTCFTSTRGLASGFILGYFCGDGTFSWTVI